MVEDEDGHGSGGDEAQGAGKGKGPDDPSELHVLVMSPNSFSSLPLPKEGKVLVGRSSKCPIRVEDPLASREHACLYVGPLAERSGLHIEDLASANGTRVRDRRIPPNKPVAFFVGEAITIGSTVIMVQQNRPALGLGRLWSHAYFESRLEDECVRAAPDAAFAVARMHLAAPIPWTKVVPILMRNVPVPHVFAAYGPRDYEILFIERSANEVMRLMEILAGDLRQRSLDARHAVAWYPRDGRSADALLAHANSLVRLRPGAGARAARAADSGPRREDSVVAPEGDPSAGAGMERLRELARRTASRNINVLILGETGAGKDVLARTIHKMSGRKGTFVALNCAGLPETLVESELFGYERGAFSGANAAKVGLLEAANGGTVFLDEIGEMPQTVQARLLRALETREVLPVGAVKTRPIDVRFLAATNRDLEVEVRNGTFRQDLFFRLNGFSLTVPPLRERVDEIPALIETFIAAACRDFNVTMVPAVATTAMRHLVAYSWPGNIRELKNTIERALVLCDGAEILPEHLPLDKMRSQPGAQAPVNRTKSTDPELVARGPGAPPAEPGGVGASAGPFGGGVESGQPGPERLDAGADGAEGTPWLKDPGKVAERSRILAALDANAWSQTRAAKSLGMPRRTFVSKLEYYRIPRPQKNGAENGTL
jgi:two-component system response regulator AtoC